MKSLTSRIEALKKLQRQRSEASPFDSATMFHAWADDVIPLLSFDPQLQAAFKHRVKSASVSMNIGSELDSMRSINECIGILNQAVAQLEHDGDNSIDVPAPAILQLPQVAHADPKITLVWVLRNMSLTAYGSLFALLGGAFLLGQWTQEMRTASLTKPLAASAATTTNPTNLSAPSKSASTASSVMTSPTQ